MMNTRLSAHAAVPDKRDKQAKSAEMDRIAAPLKWKRNRPGPRYSRNVNID
jgi:hypothetical protein